MSAESSEEMQHDILTRMAKLQAVFDQKVQERDKKRHEVAMLSSELRIMRAQLARYAKQAETHGRRERGITPAWEKVMEEARRNGTLTVEPAPEPERRPNLFEDVPAPKPVTSVGNVTGFGPLAPAPRRGAWIEGEWCEEADPDEEAVPIDMIDGPIWSAGNE